MANTADFDFDLPRERIAHAPARPRDAARLLRVADRLEDCIVTDLPGLLRPGDVLVANDTRVIPANLTAHRGAARIGITLNQPQPDGTWHALARNARRLSPGDVLTFEAAPDLTATIEARDPDGGVTLRFNRDGEAFRAALQQAGALALPSWALNAQAEEAPPVDRAAIAEAALAAARKAGASYADIRINRYRNETISAREASPYFWLLPYRTCGMYANQVCSRIRCAFCKRTSLNLRENQFNGVYGTLVGIAQHRVAHYF